MGASSRSPSPITTVPSMARLLSAERMASTAAWSAAFSSPRPIRREAASAAASVTRTASKARFRSICALPVTNRAGAVAPSRELFNGQNVRRFQDRVDIAEPAHHAVDRRLRRLVRRQYHWNRVAAGALDHRLKRNVLVT